MVAQELSSRRAYPGIVVAAITVSVAGVLGAMVNPAFGALLAFAGVWLSIRGRRQLRSQPDAAGWGLSLAAMLISSVTLAVILTMTLAPVLLSALFIGTAGVVP